jgi:uncharacterized protein involved in outer membrane biogenesis
MSRWKKILITVGLLFVVLIVAIYGFLTFYDFNKFKPRIVQAVKDATGRELTIAGNIEFELGLRPTLVVEDVSFQNAAWSSEPNLARVKRLEVQVALLPIITGKFDFAHLVLVEPEMIVEFDRAGSSNLTFETGGEEQDTEITPPPLIFNDVLIEKGLFTYRDAQSDIKFSLRIDRLTAEIPGFDKSLQIDFKGAFDDIPFALNGTVGPIWAWVEAGYALPADLTIAAGGATVQVKGEMHDPTHLKDLAFTIAAKGASTAAVTKLAGLTDIPELGAFNLKAKIADPQGSLAVEALDAHVGSEALVALSITGDVKNVTALQGIKLAFTAQGQEAANLTQLGIPPLPRKGPFKISADISDPQTKTYKIDNLNIALGSNELNGQVMLNLAAQVPYLTAELASQKFELGPASLDLQLTDPFKKPAIKKLDLKLGTPELAEIHMNGVVEDLLELKGVDINFKASGKDLANLKQLTGERLPVRGAFNAVGEVLIPVRRQLKIPDLKVAVGKNNITGSLELDLRGDRPELTAVLSLPRMDLPSVLLPELAKEGWAKGLGQVRPVKLAATLAGFAPEISIKKVDLQAGTLESIEVRLNGSVENLLPLRGMNLNFSMQGKEMAKFKEIIAQPYIFVPLPGQGAYAFSGNISNQTANDFNISNLKFVLAENEMTGRLNFNLAAQPPQYEVKLSAAKFNLKPFPIPKEAAYNKLNQLDNLGSFKLHSKITVEGDTLSLPLLDLQAGSEQLAAIKIKGSIKNLTTQAGLALGVDIRGNDIANLAKITDQPIPLQGLFALTGKLTDPARKNYKLDDLALKLGANDITGWLDLNLSGEQLQLATELAASKFTLQPVTLPALETLSRVEELGPLKLKLNLTDAGNKLALDNLDLLVGREDIIQLLLKGTIGDLAAVKGMNLAFTIKGRDISKVTFAEIPEIASIGAFQVSGQFSDPAPQAYRLSAFDAVWGDSHGSGSMELNTSGQRPRLKAELASEKLDLRPFLRKPPDKSGAEAQAAKKPSPKEIQPQANTPASKPGTQKDRVFSPDPLPFAQLQKLDADVKFQGKEILTQTLALNDIVFDILLKDGNLDIKPIKFTIGGGKADGRISLQSQKKPAVAAASLTIDQLAIGPMLDQLEYERSIEGNLDAAFDLDGTGDSIAALMAGLNGDIRIAMQDGKAESKYLELLEKYLGSGFLQMINPFKQQRQFTPINCFVDTVVIDNGKADIKLLLDTDHTSIFGAGNIDLKTERLDLGIKPTPKQGAIPTGVSFSFKELSQPFRLGGTLANPHLAIDPGRTAFVLGKFAGALALGPIGIAAFFADISVGKKNPCDVALQKAEAKIQSSDAKSGEEPAKNAGADQEKKKEEKSGGFFKKLFGK